MVLGSASLCVVFLFGSLGFAQNFNSRHASLQNMIDYTAQFANQKDNSAHPRTDPLETGKLADDPFVKNLFQEFLLQYQQLASEQKSQAIPTTTTPQTHFQPDYSLLYTSPLLQQTTPRPQRRRLSPRRNMNAPQAARASFNQVTDATTPFSTLLSRVNSLHHESVETTTAFPSLRQRFFAVESSQPKKAPSRNQQTFPVLFQTTAAPHEVVNELPATTQPPIPVPHLKTPQHLVINPSIPPVTPTKVQTATRKAVKSEFDESEFRRQAESAKYEFASDVNDEINGNLHQREEVRDGLAVKGRYSFSDGFFKRTVHYEADDKGYRVIKEEVEPLEGPQGNPDGQARVSSYVAGSAVNYQITKDDIPERNQKTTYHAPKNRVVFDEIEEF